MSVDGVKAHDTLLTYAPLTHKGACWYYVWKAYAAAGATTSMNAIPTALQAWNATMGKHPGDRNPPPGAAIWLGARYDGNQDGDVFIAGAHDGDHAATDQPTWGAVATTSIADRIALTGRAYLGWSDHVLDCPISIDTTPDDTTTPTLLEDEMILIESLPDRGRAVIGAGYFRKLNNSEELSQATHIVSAQLHGNARQFDLWKSIALAGTAAAGSVTLTDAQLDAIANAAREGGADAIRGLEFIVTAE